MVGGIEMALSFHPSVHPLFRPSNFLKFLHIWRQRADWIEFRFDGWTHYEHPLALWSCCAEFPSFPVIWLVEQFSYIHRQTTVQIGGWIYPGIPHVSLTFRHAPRNFQPLLALDLWSNFRTFTGVLLIKLAQIWWVKLLMGLCRSYQLLVTLRLIPVMFCIWLAPQFLRICTQMHWAHIWWANSLRDSTAPIYIWSIHSHRLLFHDCLVIFWFKPVYCHAKY